MNDGERERERIGYVALVVSVEQRSADRDLQEKR
jgi:hypothetical protein